MRWDRSPKLHSLSIVTLVAVATLFVLAAPAVADTNSTMVEEPIKPKVVFLLSICPSPKLIDAAEDYPHLESDIYLTENLPDDCDLTQYDLVFVDWLWKMTPNLDRLLPLIDEAKAHDVPVIVTKSYYTVKPEEIGNIDPAEHPWVRQYWDNMSEENANSLLTYLGVEFLGMDCGEIKEPIPITHEGIYHPDAEQVFGSLSDYLKWYDYDPDKPTIGILFHETDYINSGTRVEDSLIQAFEDRGFNVVSYFYPHSGRPDPDNFLISITRCLDGITMRRSMRLYQNLRDWTFRSSKDRNSLERTRSGSMEHRVSSHQRSEPLSSHRIEMVSLIRSCKQADPKTDQLDRESFYRSNESTIQG